MPILVEHRVKHFVSLCHTKILAGNHHPQLPVKGDEIILSIYGSFLYSQIIGAQRTRAGVQGSLGIHAIWLIR